MLPQRPLDPRRAPRPGDTWRYAYDSGWANQPNWQFEVRCLEVGSGIRDRLNQLGSTVGDERTFFGTWEVVSRPLGGGVGLTEFSPYLDAFDSATVGLASAITMPRVTDIGTAWSGSASARATETLQTPAGAFDAVRVDITANRPFIRGQMDDVSDPVYMVSSAWFAPRAKRVVRFVNRTFGQQNNPLSRASYELIGLTLK
jgi:hypothetical protein